MGVDDLIVRLYFEMNGFLVRPVQMCTVQARVKRSDDDYGWFVYNANYKAEDRQPNLLLFSSELPLVERALVVVKGQHSPKYAAATLRSSAAIAKFLEKDVLKQADHLFNVDDETIGAMGNLLKILVIPGLPTHEPHKSQSVEILTKIGIDAALSFRSILQDVVSKVQVNNTCLSTDILHMVYLLKTYDMIKPQQLELFNERK